jgi:hypothetical protein
VASKEYIEQLQMVIWHMHKCRSTHVETVPVKETFQGQTAWEGEVEVFTVDHADAKHCYAWGTSDGQFTAVLGLPPATTPLNAVKVAIVAASKR